MRAKTSICRSRGRERMKMAHRRRTRARFWIWGKSWTAPRTLRLRRGITCGGSEDEEVLGQRRRRSEDEDGSGQRGEGLRGPTVEPNCWLRTSRYKACKCSNISAKAEKSTVTGICVFRWERGAYRRAINTSCELWECGPQSGGIRRIPPDFRRHRYVIVK